MKFSLWMVATIGVILLGVVLLTKIAGSSQFSELTVSVLGDSVQFQMKK